VAGLIWSIEDLVVEYREIQGKTETDRMRGSQIGLGNFSGSLVGLERLVGGLLALVANGEFGKVAVVVALPRNRQSVAVQIRGRKNEHLVVKDLGLSALSRRNEMLVKNFENVLADLGKLGLDLLAVLLDEADLVLVSLGLLLLLNGADDSPGCATGTNDVLVGNGKQIALLNGEFLVGRCNSLHVLDHFLGFVRIRDSRRVVVCGVPSYRSACSASLARKTESSYFGVAMVGDLLTKD